MHIGCTLVAHLQCQSGVYAHRMHISCTFGHGMLVLLKVDTRNPWRPIFRCALIDNRGWGKNQGVILFISKTGERNWRGKRRPTLQAHWVRAAEGSVAGTPAEGASPGTAPPRGAPAGRRRSDTWPGLSGRMACRGAAPRALPSRLRRGRAAARQGSALEGQALRAASRDAGSSAGRGLPGGVRGTGLPVLHGIGLEDRRRPALQRLDWGRAADGERRRDAG